MRVNAVIDRNSAGSTVSSVINSRTWTLRLYCVPPPAAGVAVTLGRPAANPPHGASSSIANKILDTKRNMACLTQPCACAELTQKIGKRHEHRTIRMRGFILCMELAGRSDETVQQHQLPLHEAHQNGRASGWERRR